MAANEIYLSWIILNFIPGIILSFKITLKIPSALITNLTFDLFSLLQLILNKPIPLSFHELFSSSYNLALTECIHSSSSSPVLVSVSLNWEFLFSSFPSFLSNCFPSLFNNDSNEELLFCELPKILLFGFEYEANDDNETFIDEPKILFWGEAVSSIFGFFVVGSISFLSSTFLSSEAFEASSLFSTDFSISFSLSSIFLVLFSDSLSLFLLLSILVHSKNYTY